MSRLTLRHLSVSLLAFWAAICSMSAPAKTFPPYGAGGDASFSDSCPPNQYLVGLHVAYGYWIDRMAILCRFPINDVGTTSDAQREVDSRNYVGPMRGGNGGGSQIWQAQCPKAGLYLVRKMDFTMTKGNRQVAHFTLRCDSLAMTKSEYPPVSPGVGAAAMDGNVAAPGQACPDGEAATGIQGHYGKHVNAIGLICSSIDYRGERRIHPPRQKRCVPQQDSTGKALEPYCY